MAGGPACAPSLRTRAFKRAPPPPPLQIPSLLGLDLEGYDGPTGQFSNKLVRMDSKDVVQKAQQEMQHLKRHFLVAVMHDPDLPPMQDNDPVISTDLTDSRQTFLGQCQMCHWQFNTLRHAQYSTMMILNHIHNKVLHASPCRVHAGAASGRDSAPAVASSATGRLRSTPPTHTQPPTLPRLVSRSRLTASTVAHAAAWRTALSWLDATCATTGEMCPSPCSSEPFVVMPSPAHSNPHQVSRRLRRHLEGRGQHDGLVSVRALPTPD